jgi:hypothetical protein
MRARAVFKGFVSRHNGGAVIFNIDCFGGAFLTRRIELSLYNQPRIESELEAGEIKRTGGT